jgi:hypothetical protein
VSWPGSWPRGSSWPEGSENLEGLPSDPNECVRNLVEGEVTSEGHLQFRCPEKRRRYGVSIVTSSEITVVGRDDRK